MPPLTLDDVAALLVSLEPTDHGEFARPRDELRRHADGAGLSDAARRFARDAADRLDAALQPHLPEGKRAALLAEAARLVGAAVIAGEAFELESVAEAPDDEWAAALAEDDGAPAPAATAAARAAFTDVLPVDADMELLGEFLAESREYLEKSEAALLALEADQGDIEAINTVFRAFHTVKGTAAFMGLARVTDFAHHAESVLSRVREAEIPYTRDCADVALRATDMLRLLLEAVQCAAPGGPISCPDGYDECFAEVVRLERAEPDEVAAGLAPRPAAAAPAPVPPATPAEREAAAAALKAAREARAEVAAAVEATVRVRTDRLDRLVDIVGELVIAQTMIASDGAVAAAGQHDLQKKVTHAAKIVRELQDLSMSMRMVPLRATFQKIARLVRDLAHRSGKLIEFQAEGEEVEIDRHLVDAIGDPLVHMVRNAIDHGIEHAADRLRAGKSPAGTIRMRAQQSGGTVVVELADDGRGLNRERIIAKAIERGIVQPDQRLSDADAFNLIFSPGFSTAERITDLSGRGVGMDVVRRNVEGMRGRIEIASEPGRGSTFSLRLPLTLAITDGMLVRVGAERYIVPIMNIQMSFRPEAAMLSTIAGRGEMVRLRDAIMPVVRLHRLFDVPGAKTDPREALLMVVTDGERLSALLVDELLGQHQVVAKSLGAGVGVVPGVSGGAILGDGHVGLILDVPRVVEAAREGEARAA